MRFWGIWIEFWGWWCVWWFSVVFGDRLVGERDLKFGVCEWIVFGMLLFFVVCFEIGLGIGVGIGCGGCGCRFC